MINSIKRRDFIKTAAAGAIGLGFAGKPYKSGITNQNASHKVGIIGLDTSHSVAFISTLNKADAGPEFGGYKVVAAYPKGSSEIKSSYERIPKYTEDAIKQGVEIVNSIDELLLRVDVVLLETNDGRLHLEQAIPVLKAGKRMFIDKPVAASLSDAIAIYRASEHFKVPVFSSSSLRYIAGMKEIHEGSIGKVLHGVETLFTAMGTGCKSVVRSAQPNFDHVTGTWSDGRIGSFRGIRSGRSDYGGTVFGEKGIAVLGKYSGYNALLLEIVKFFQTGIVPVSPAETIEIFSFMAAADESKIRGGVPVEIAEVRHKAEQAADKISFK